jgi:hypothetical protein
MKFMKNNKWPLGFLGLLALLGVPAFTKGEWIDAVWFLWIIWFIYFFPKKKKE